jgi:hypothetical protein
VTNPVKQGWYQDPAGRHEYRWFSEGAPTDLVMDGHETSMDAAGIVRDAAAYASMDLAEPSDGDRLPRPDDAPRTRLEIMNFGAGPVSAIEVPDDEA